MLGGDGDDVAPSRRPEMSTLPDPRDEREGRPLSARERAVLDHIAGSENAGDPGFVSRLRERPGEPAGVAGMPPERVETRREALARARRRDLTIQAAVVLGLAALLLPAAWLVAAVVTLVLLAVPLVLVGLAWREARDPKPEVPPWR
jgi:hypothetical protein